MAVRNSREGDLTTIHLLPSSSFFGGFLVRMLSGFGFLPGGAGDFPLIESELPFRSGTLLCERSDGFLCVICDASTFFKDLVMASPWFNWSKTAPMS